MASTSSSAAARRSPSPPPPPPPPPPALPPPQSSLRNPFEPDIQSPPRNYIEEIANKRRKIEQRQDKSLIHGFTLQEEHAARILQCNSLVPLREAIDEYAQTKNQRLLTIFKSFARLYPNSFSFKLAKILQLQPSLQIRTEVVTFLLITLHEGVNKPMNSSILLQLKNPLLNSLMMESEEIMFPWLCELIGQVAERLYLYSLGGWDELLQYFITCLSGESELNNKKGFIMLTEFPVDVAQNKEFWLNDGRFDLVCAKILESVYSDDNESKALGYNAAISLMLLSKDLQRTNVSEILLPMLLNIIDQHEEDAGLVSKLKRLVDLVTLDDGNILRGKHREVFWCMIQVAEIEDASDELRYEAVNIIRELDKENVTAMEGVIKNLSLADMRRVVEVAINMMACIVEDPLWFDVDNDDCKSAGFTENFNLGQYLLNCLCLDGVDRVFVPTAIDIIRTKFASDMLWRLRHAAMFAIASIAEKNFNGMGMIHHFEKVAMLVLNSLDELHYRVLWATMHAIKHLSECKQLLMHTQYDKKFLEKLVPIAKCNSCARVQSYAVIAIRLLVITCGLDKISPFGEPIIASLLILLKHEKMKLQGDAIDALKSIAVSMPGIFRQNHYDSTMEALKVTVFNKYSLPKLFLRAKCLECMVYLVRKVGPDNFIEEEAVQVVESLISLDGKLSKTQYLIKCIVLKALEQICQCPRVSIDKFIDKITPMLLVDDKPYEDRFAIIFYLDDDEKRLVETMRVRACNTLSYCAVRSSINFSPHIGKVTQMFIRLLGCSSFKIRKASILGLSKLLLSLKVGDRSNQTKRETTLIIVQALVTFLKHMQETDRDLSALVLRLLARCIQTFSSFFTDQLIKDIADELNDTIKKIIKFEIEKAQEEGTSEDLDEPLPPEEPTEEAVQLIATAIDTFGDQFMLHVDTLMSNVVVFLADDKPDREIAFAISIFNVIFPLFPDKLPQYHGKYGSISYLALRKNYPCARLHATRAIGICAMFGGDQFKASARGSILILYNVMSNGRSTLCDTAVASLGKIYEFHRDCISDPEMVEKWLNFLPLKHDFNEARYAHGLLVKLIQRSDEYLFGSNNKNLPRIISVVKGILSGPDRLGTEEAITQMIDFVEKHRAWKS
ncbi:ran-binding protein 6-like [Trifolium pratense]|uniref:ran-binding protein 6-like n=1 Tax=Trifolium pratense TaxID=57577 RepID=UPI001E6942D3|nr:ran-binding protein 6-like [Trifolium pratense]